MSVLLLALSRWVCSSLLGLDDFECFEHWTRAVFLGAAESFQLRIEIADKHDIVGKVVDSLKQPKVRISIWEVNGSQN